MGTAIKAALIAMATLIPVGVSAQDPAICSNPRVIGPLFSSITTQTGDSDSAVSQALRDIREQALHSAPYIDISSEALDDGRLVSSTERLYAQDVVLTDLNVKQWQDDAGHHAEARSMAAVCDDRLAERLSYRLENDRLREEVQILRSELLNSGFSTPPVTFGPEDRLITREKTVAELTELRQNAQVLEDERAHSAGTVARSLMAAVKIQLGAVSLDEDTLTAKISVELDCAVFGKAVSPAHKITCGKWFLEQDQDLPALTYTIAAHESMITIPILYRASGLTGNCQGPRAGNNERIICLNGIHEKPAGELMIKVPIQQAAPELLRLEGNMQIVAPEAIDGSYLSGQ